MSTLNRGNLLNETVYQWYLDFGPTGSCLKIVELYPEFRSIQWENKIKSKVNSLAYAIRNASAFSRKEILSKPFKPPNTRIPIHDDDDSPEESQPLGRRKSSSRARINYNVKDMATPRGLTAYDSEGRLVNYKSYNLCDCLEAQCPGCHFPCHRCGSEKCGNECRNRRKWTFESIEIEGTDSKIRFPKLL